jgi:hypothetical protein
MGKSIEWKNQNTMMILRQKCTWKNLCRKVEWLLKNVFHNQQCFSFWQFSIFYFFLSFPPVHHAAWTITFKHRSQFYTPGVKAESAYKEVLLFSLLVFILSLNIILLVFVKCITVFIFTLSRGLGSQVG